MDIYEECKIDLNQIDERFNSFARPLATAWNTMMDELHINSSAFTEIKHSVKMPRHFINRLRSIVQKAHGENEMIDIDGHVNILICLAIEKHLVDLEKRMRLEKNDR